ncbi:hypothetical protein RRG08_062469 [Elysia crispata]|uniref:Uncharacterized protein n=1 Tax=Elysia crispata TaxID=231223 RepID=A0AAE0XNM2_9GAST|nr:hypothetical protein RRG08_062469 [Elysia crispata]
MAGKKREKVGKGGGVGGGSPKRVAAESRGTSNVGHSNLRVASRLILRDTSREFIVRLRKNTSNVGDWSFRFCVVIVGDQSVSLESGHWLGVTSTI